MKLHWACGDVYLADHRNLDIKGTVIPSSAKYSNPNLTRLDEYYKFPYGHERREYLVDAIENILEPWKYKDGSIESVVIVSSIEHFTKKEAWHIFSECHRVLQKDGSFYLDFPDLVGIMSTMRGEEALRQIYCHGSDPQSFHKWGYFKDTIENELGKIGFKAIIFTNLVHHDYPMIGVLAIK